MAPDSRLRAIEMQTAEIVDEHLSLEGPMLPILHEVQHQFGYVPKESLPVIAEKLNLSNAEVHGVVSFYHDYREQPAGRHVIKICRAEACQSMGVNELSDRLLSKLGLDWGQTDTRENVTVEAVYCLGMCACAPAAMVDDKIIARLDQSKIDAIVKQVAS